MGKSRQRRLASRGQPAPPRLTSRFLEARASEFTSIKFAQRFGFPLTQPLLFPVFETPLGEKTVYCCLAGGHLVREGAMWFTEIGQAVSKALLRLLTTDSVILQELKHGRIPLHRAIRKTVEEAAPPGACICFLVIWPANWIGWPLRH